MTLPSFDSPLHADHEFLFGGVPVFENNLINQPLIINVPIPGTSERRPKLLVPNLQRFRDEIWIEQQLSTIVSREMGDTLEWLYGNRRWVSPSSRYSMLLLRLQVNNMGLDFQRAFTEMGRRMNEYVRTVRSAWQAVDGLSTSLADSGSTATPPVDGPST